MQSPSCTTRETVMLSAGFTLQQTAICPGVSAGAVLCTRTCSTKAVHDHYGYKCKIQRTDAAANIPDSGIPQSARAHTSNLGCWPRATAPRPNLAGSLKRISKTSVWSEPATGPVCQNWCCLVSPQPSTQEEPSDKQACFVCSAQDFFLKTPPCFYLCWTQTTLLAACFPSRNSTKWVSSSLEFTSSCRLDGMGLGLHLSSHSAFPRSMMYSVKARILWTTKVLFPQGKCRIFLCAQFPLKCKQKIIFKEKLRLWNYFS